MLDDHTIIKMIFGLKLKYLRHQQELSLEQLAALTGLSKSYVHDIEKGRKYPKIDKINALAQSLGVDYDFLVSTQSSKKLQPIFDLLSSDFVKEFPLGQFGIDPDKLFELFSNTPDKVNAFVGTLFKVMRNYQMERESFYLAALRSYQDLHDNYFETLERAVKQFREKFDIRGTLPYTTAFLEHLLRRRCQIEVDRHTLRRQPELSGTRSYFSEKKKTLFLNQGLSSAQENFLLARELGLQFMELLPRPYLTRIVEVDSFEKLLNNFRASYFSVALLMDEEELAGDLRRLAERRQWEPDTFLHLLDKYDVTSEMLLQRMTNILPKHFGIHDLFFIRLAGDEDLRRFKMTKELHLSRLHNPYANELNEHYCRRWVSINIIKKLRARQQLENTTAPIVDAQISSYWQTPNSYLCLSIAKSDTQPPFKSNSVTVGLLINEQLRRQFAFLDDPGLSRRTVHTTCERCGIPNCEARAAAPVALERQHRHTRIREALVRIEE